MNADSLITTEELAATVGVTSRRIRQLLAAGKLRGRLMGGMWVLSRSEAKRFAGLRKIKPGRPRIGVR